MTLKTILPLLTALAALAACQPQQETTKPPGNHTPAQSEASSAAPPQNPPSVQPPAGSSPMTHSEAEIRAAQNAQPGQQLTATRSSLSGNMNGTDGSSGGLKSTGSQLTGNITGLASKETEQGLELDMSSDVLFDFGKAEIKTEALPVLEEAAKIIRSRSNSSSVTVTGHTDSKGNEAYNLQLSLKRAETVKNWFVAHGLTNAFTVEGKGETEPIAKNQHSDGSDNPEGRAQNRRVGILIRTVPNN